MTPHPLTPPATQLRRPPDFASALACTLTDPSAIVEFFVESWMEVEVLRVLVSLLGYTGRVCVHHRAALDTLVELEVLAPRGPRRVPGVARVRGMETFFRAATAAAGFKILTH